MVNIKKAITYVKAHGDEIEKNRLNCIFLGKPAPKAVQKELKKLQNPDGGFSYWVKEFSTVFDTIYILTWMDDLLIREGDIIEHAFDFLITNQQSDGGWDEVNDLENSVEALDFKHGEIDTRVFLTAYCAHWFVRFGRAEPPEAKGCPMEFLKEYRAASGLILDDLQATWDSLVLFSYHPGRKSELFNDTLDVIEKKFSPDNWEGAKLAYLLCCLRDSGLDAYHPFVNLCIDELIQKQQNNGSWVSEYGEEFATDTTIGALRVLKHYNVV